MTSRVDVCIKKGYISIFKFNPNLCAGNKVVANYVCSINYTNLMNFNLIWPSIDGVAYQCVTFDS